MALLAFDIRKSPVGDLLDHSQRQKIASELNAAILTSQCQEKDPKLPSMLKMLIWAQVYTLNYMVFACIIDLLTCKYHVHRFNWRNEFHFPKSPISQPQNLIKYNIVCASFTEEIAIVQAWF